MELGDTGGFQSPVNTKILFGLSMSPQIENMLSRESLYYHFKILLRVCVKKGEGILTVPLRVSY